MGMPQTITFQAPDFSFPNTLLPVLHNEVGGEGTEIVAITTMVQSLSGSRPSSCPRSADAPILPLLGPTMMQSIECPHRLICKSRVPHDFPEAQPIPWPTVDMIPNLAIELANPGPGHGYLAQQSLLNDPVDLSQLVLHALGSRKSKSQLLLTFSPKQVDESSELQFKAKAPRHVMHASLSSPPE